MSKEYIVRSLESRARIELSSAREFTKEAVGYFKQSLKEFKKSAPPRHKWDEGEEMYHADMVTEIEGNQDLSCYFGLMLTYSALERYFQGVYETTSRLGTIPELREVILTVTRKWLRLEDFGTFSKRLGIDLTKKPFEWNGLLKLQEFRNAIAHQRGFITDDNLKALSKYKKSSGENYKEYDSLEVSLNDVLQNIALVEQTTKDFGVAFVKVLKTKGLLK